MKKVAASNKGNAGITYNRDMYSIQSLKTIIEWCSTKKICVDFGKAFGGAYSSDKKLIVINGRLSPEIQLYVLMHECGHYLVGDRTAGQRYGFGYQAIGTKDEQTIKHRIDVIDEELEAWARGLKLAKRLDVKIDIDRFSQTRSEYIVSYLKWALKIDDYVL